MAVVAVKVGGSVLAPNEVDLEFVRRVSRMLLRASKRHQIYLVVGGGRLARRYITGCRMLGADEGFLDEVGIDASRLNARVLISGLGDAVYHIPATDFDEAKDAGHRHRLVVMGGTHPGHTTDAVCAMLAEKVGAKRLVITTNVDGIYTEDPKRNKRAKLLSEVTPGELVALCGRGMGMAGSSGAVDPLAAKIIARSGIPTVVVNGNNIKNVEAAIEGKRVKGTVIRP